MLHAALIAAAVVVCILLLALLAHTVSVLISVVLGGMRLAAVLVPLVLLGWAVHWFLRRRRGP